MFRYVAQVVWQGVTLGFQGASSSEILWNRYSVLGLACILLVCCYVATVAWQGRLSGDCLSVGRLLHAWVAFCIQGRLLGVSRLLPAWVALGHAPSMCDIFSGLSTFGRPHCRPRRLSPNTLNPPKVCVCVCVCGARENYLQHCPGHLFSSRAHITSLASCCPNQKTLKGLA